MQTGRFYAFQHKLLEALHEDRSVCNLMIVVETGGRQLRDDAGGFEACGNNSLTQENVGGVCEVSQHTTRYAIRTRGLM